jgi:DNA transposition AAA+ family ATPase
MRLFSLCQAERELGLVTGEPGVGKSSAARRYAAKTATAHLVTMSPASSALVPSLARIGSAVGAYASATGACAWSDAIRTVLTYDPDPHVLLIDEAHHLSDQSVEEVRAIFDAARVGVVFIGSRELRERWSGKRWAQLTSRVFLRIDLEGPQAEDIDAICSALQIEGKRSRTLLLRAASRPGGLRLVRKVADVAARLAGPGSIVTAEHVEKALASRGEMAA